MELVSVIIPLYKSEAFIAQTLDSVITQTYPNWEVICVDDCSPDNTAAIVRAYGVKDSRIRYLKHEKNTGAPAFGRNTGIAAARGAYITFLDHDDSFLPTKLEDLVKAIEKENVDFICSNCYLVNNKTGRPDLLAWGSVTGNIVQGFAKRLLESNFVPPNSTLIRSSVFDTVIGFDTTLRGVDDYDLWYRIAREYPSTVYEKPLCTWRYSNKESISANQSLMIEDELCFYEKILCMPDISELESKIAQQGIQRAKKHLAGQRLLASDYKAARVLYEASGQERIANLLRTVPGLVRLIYALKRTLVPQFRPINLVF